MDRKIIDEYIAAAKAEKEAKARKEKLRPAALAFFKEFGSVDDCNYRNEESESLIDDKVLEWVAQALPDRLEELTKKTLDREKLTTLIVEGVVDLKALPEGCIVKSYKDVITPVYK